MGHLQQIKGQLVKILITFSSVLARPWQETFLPNRCHLNATLALQLLQTIYLSSVYENEIKEIVLSLKKICSRK